MCVHIRVCVCVHVYSEVREQFTGVCSLFLPGMFWDQILVFRLGNKCPCPPSHLPDSWFRKERTNSGWCFVVVPEPYSADPRRKEIGAGGVPQFDKSFCLALATRDCLKNIQAKGKSGLDISLVLRRQRQANN